MDKSNANGWKSRKYKTSIIVGSEKKPTKFESGQVIINQKATEKNLDKLIKINKDGLEGKQKTEVTNDATDGGLLIGKPHYDKNGKPLGGIPGKVDGVKLIETETAEFVLNKEASEKHWKELSKINTSTGGVPINPPNKFDDDPEYDYKKGGNVIEFNPNHLPSKSIMNFANDVREKYPKVWDLGGNIFGNEAFKNLMTVRKRGYWLDSEEWMYIKWRAYVARHIHDYRIAGVIAMLKWGDKVEKGFPYMKELVEKEIEKRYKKELKESGGKLKLKYGGAITYKEKYNKAYGFEPKQSHSLEDISKTTGISLIGLQAIYNKGIGAYKTNPRSVRPSVKSKEQWAMARVYSAVMGGRAAKIDANELKLELGGSLDRRNLIYIGEQGSTNLSENEKINWGINEFDNKLRFEIDNSEFELVNFDVLYERAKLNPNTEFKIKLSEVVVHPTLFKAYPELSNLELSYIYLSDTTQIASYNPKQNIIKYNFYGEDNQINSSDSISGLEEKAKRDKEIIRTNKLFQGRRDDLRKRVLLHELQHFAQYYDNLAEGSSIMREYRKLLQENEIDERRIGTAERDLLIQQAIINNQSNLGEMEAKDSEIRMNLSLDERKEIEPFTLLPYEVDKVIVTNTNIKSNNLKDKMEYGGSVDEMNQLKSQINKLYTKAFKMMPNSPRQKEVIKQIDELRIKLENMNGKFESGGSTELLAPNGKKSNLTSKQYNLVRTPKFKAWFGDWENDPENASKVVDENGEPLVVYHGSNSGFNIFNYVTNQFFFSDNKNVANSYRNKYVFKEDNEIGVNENEFELFKDEVILNPIPIYKVFLNLRNPKIKNYNKSNWLETPIEKDIDKNKDGFIAKNIIDGAGIVANTYIAFKSEQIKLADGTNTTFDGNNPDIRFDGGGNVLLAPNGKPSNLTPEQYKLVRTPAFKEWFGDWENDPENASKIVDENGEPKVMYSGSPNKFTIFQTDEIEVDRDDREYKKRFWFIANKENAEDYSRKATGNISNVYICFLNIRNPKYDFNLYIEDNQDGSVEFLNKKIWVAIATNSNQIKLADGTNTTFDSSNPDIRFEHGGSTDAKDTATIDIPLLIRLLELSREDIDSDAELHQVVERLLDLKNKPILTMDDYAYIADIEHKHVNQMATGGTLDSDPQKLISQAHYNITVKKGRKEYAPTAHEIQEEIDRMVMEGQFGSNNI